MSRIADLRSRFETPKAPRAEPPKPPVPTGRRLLAIPGAAPSTPSASAADAARKAASEATASAEPASPARLIHLHEEVAPPGTGALMAAQRRAAEAELDASMAEPSEPSEPAAAVEAPSQAPAPAQAPAQAEPTLMMTEMDGTMLENPFASAASASASASASGPAGEGEGEGEGGRETSSRFSTIDLGQEGEVPRRSSDEWNVQEASRAGRAGRQSALYGAEAPSELRDEFERARRASRHLDAEPESEEDRIDWSFWGRVMNDYQDVARNRPEELSAAVQAGLPDTLRGMVWQLMSGSKNEELELIYAYYLKEQQNEPAAEAVRRDVLRSLASPAAREWMHSPSPPNATAVGNIVAAYSLYDPACGACQGLQYVVAALVGTMPDEEAFGALVRLMRVYDLRGHYAPGLPSLQLRLYQLARLVEDQAPLLHAHLARNKVKVADYAAPWLMTAFTYRFPPSLARRVLDAVFAEGLEVLFRFALVLLLENEERLLQLGQTEALTLLRDSVLDPWIAGEKGEVDVNRLARQAFALRLDTFDLDTYASEFDEKVRAAAAHRREMDALKLVHKNLTARVRALEDAAAAQSAEHVELTKQIVVANLAREEMADELAKYKMMYAEAVLAADQARARSSSSFPGPPTPGSVATSPTA